MSVLNQTIETFDQATDQHDYQELYEKITRDMAFFQNQPFGVNYQTLFTTPSQLYPREMPSIGLTINALRCDFCIMGDYAHREVLFSPPPDRIVHPGFRYTLWLGSEFLLTNPRTGIHTQHLDYVVIFEKDKVLISNHLHRNRAHLSRMSFCQYKLDNPHLSHWLRNTDTIL